MRVRAVVVASAFLAVCVVPTVRAASWPSPYPGGRYVPPKARFGTSEDAGIPILMDDGTKIVLDVVYPTENGKRPAQTGKTFPVLITQDIYNAGPLALAMQATNTSSVPGQYFVERAYIYIHMDVRGTGRSEGVDDLFGDRSARDGLTVAYWAADPANVPGSNGTVGLEGCSALGITQLASLIQLGQMERLGGGTVSYSSAGRSASWRVDAKTNPIKAAIPQCLSGDMFRDTFFDGGIPSGIWDFTFAGPALGGVNTNEPTANIEPNRWFIDMSAGGEMGYYRTYWQLHDRVARANDLGRTGVPLLMWVGWGEGGFIGAQELYSVVQNVAAGKADLWGPMTPDQKPNPRYQVIVGDWGHAGGLDPGIEIEWYDTYLKGADSGLGSAGEPVHLKELPSAASSRWINATAYPMTSSYAPYYLSGAGALSKSVPAASAPDAIIWAPQQSVTYTLAQAWSQDMTLIGPSAASIWAQSSNANLQLFAELEDVAPGGTVTPITHASVLGSRSQLDPLHPTKSWTASNGLPIRPYQGLDHDDPITPNTPVRLDIPIQPTAWRLVKGHKLQLLLMSQAPQSECALSVKIGAAPVGCQWNKPMLASLAGGVYEILHDAIHPSLVNLALVPSARLATARAGTTPTSGGVPLPTDWG